MRERGGAHPVWRVPALVEVNRGFRVECTELTQNAEFALAHFGVVAIGFVVVAEKVHDSVGDEAGQPVEHNVMRLFKGAQ